MRYALVVFLFIPCAYAADPRASDSFTEAANTNLASHTPSPAGTSWDESNTDGDMRVNGANDNAENVNGATRRATEGTNIGTPDMVVEADIAITSNAAAANAAVYAREASASTFGDHYACGLEDDVVGAGGTADLTLVSRVGGAAGTLDEANNFNGTIGTVYRVRLRVVGSQIDCCIDHTTCISVENTEVTSGNFAGVRTLASSSQTIDNFKSSPHRRID